MTAVLATFFTAWLVEDLAHLHTDVIVLGVVLALTIGRAHRHGEAGAVTALGTLVVVSVAAGAVGTLMLEHVTLGDTLFTVALAAGIWVRRFSPAVRRVGRLVSLPFIAVLVTPAPAGFGTRQSLWTAVIAAIAVGWVLICQQLASRFDPPAPEPARFQAPKRAVPSGRLARVPASSKMAAQMGVGIGLAFLVGHQLFPQHWPWVVLTAYIVASGNRGRGDVVYKSGLRLIGAGVGTIGATLLANAFDPGDRWAVVAIFAVVTVALSLRELNYAYWAAGVTAALALLYGYYGQTGTRLLATRLEAIACGALLAVAASWFVLPIKTGQVVRRRVADSLAVLSDYLTAARRRDLIEVRNQQRRFEAALLDVEQLRPTLVAHRLLTRPFGATTHHLDALGGLQTLHRSTTTITARAGDDPELLGRTAGELKALHTTLTSTRRRIGGLPVEDEPDASGPGELPGGVESHAALLRIAAALSR